MSDRVIGVKLHPVAEEVLRQLGENGSPATTLMLDVERYLQEQTPKELCRVGRELVQVARYLRLHGRPGEGKALAELVERAARKVAVRTGRVRDRRVAADNRHTAYKGTPPEPKLMPGSPREESSPRQDAACLRQIWPKMDGGQRDRLTTLATELEAKLKPDQ